MLSMEKKKIHVQQTCPYALTSLRHHVGGTSHCFVHACDLRLAHFWQLRLLRNPIIIIIIIINDLAISWSARVVKSLTL